MELNKLNHPIHSNSGIDINNLKVWLPEEKSWWRRKVTKPKKIILNDVSGYIKSGEFLAIIGPSGAGKTTLLTSLAGKCVLPYEGQVKFKSRNVKDFEPGVVELLPQFDVFMDSLSVVEHLTFMTEMKLGSVRNPQNSAILASLLHELKLKPIENNPINSLSGGERRLLSLATSLLSSPLVLICDEPTTGLDSYNALLVISVLKKLSKAGKTVICSVHQPSSDLFREFTSVCLMSEGKLLFNGTQRDCKELFERINLHCPINYNPAEFYIKAVSAHGDDNYVERLLENKRDPSYSDDGTSLTQSTTPTATFPTCQRGWFKQVQLLVWRSLLTVKNDTIFFLFQLFLTTVISSMIIGTCYLGISGRTQQGVQDLRGFLWLLLSEVSFSLSYIALYAFHADLPLFKREVGVYKTSAFYMCRFLTLIPRCIIWPIVYVTIATLTVQLPNHILTALKFSAALVITGIASSAYGLGMGALFSSSGVMGDVMPCADLPLLLMSGALLRISSLPVWLYPVKYISHFFYGMDAISNIYWSQIDWIECPTNSTTACYQTGIEVLTENGYTNYYIFDVLGILSVTIIWSLLGYYGLKREENKGFV
ncbi:unnamed protein product, partial [Leptidea sinapis]